MPRTVPISVAFGKAIVLVSAMPIAFGFSSEAGPSDRPSGASLIDPSAGPLPKDVVRRIGSPRMRHAGEVTALAFSPDGVWLASASSDATDASVRLWDVATGLQRLRIAIARPGNSAGVRGVPVVVRFGPDGRLRVLDCKSFRSIEIPTGQEKVKHEFVPDLPAASARANAFPIAGLAIAPDAQSFVVVSHGGRLAVYDAQTGQSRARIEHPMNWSSYVSVEFSHDSRKFVLDSTGDKPAIVFNAQTAEKIAGIATNGFRQDALQFLPDGRLFGMITVRNTVGRQLVFFETDTGELKTSWPAPRDSFRFAVSPDGRTIVTSSATYPLSDALDAATGKTAYQLPSVPNIRRLMFSPNGKLMAGAVSTPGPIVVWDVAARALHPSSADPKQFVETSFSSDGQTISVHAPDRASVDWRTGEIVRRLAPVDDREQLNLTEPVLSPNQKLFAVHGRGGAIRIADSTTGRTQRIIHGPRQPTRPAFSFDSRRIAAHDDGQSIHVWSVSDGSEIAHVQLAEKSFIRSVALSADGGVVAALVRSRANQDVTLMAWGTNSERPTPLFRQSVHDVGTFAMSLSGEFVVCGGPREISRPLADGDLWLWDSVSGRCLHALRGLARRANLGIGPFSFSPDGRWFAVGDTTGPIRIWEVLSGQEVVKLVGHESQPLPNFSPDGRHIVAVSSEAPCFVWDFWGAASGHSPPVDERAWADLIGADAAAAFQAARRFVAHPPAGLAMIRAHDSELPRDEFSKLDALIRELDSPSFAVRERASADLQAMAHRCEKRLLEARERGSLEVRTRINAILDGARGPSHRRVVIGRVLSVLEAIGTPDAMELLKKWASEPSASILSTEAAASLKRDSDRPRRE